jgi:hypothetical protein
VLAQQGTRLNQIRFVRGNPPPSDTKLTELDQTLKLVYSDSDGPLPAIIKNGLWISVDLEGEASNGIIGYRAKHHAPRERLGRASRHRQRHAQVQTHARLVGKRRHHPRVEVGSLVEAAGSHGRARPARERDELGILGRRGNGRDGEPQAQQQGGEKAREAHGQGGDQAAEQPGESIIASPAPQKEKRQVRETRTCRFDGGSARPRS